MGRSRGQRSLGVLLPRTPQGRCPKKGAQARAGPPRPGGVSRRSTSGCRKVGPGCGVSTGSPLASLWEAGTTGRELTVSTGMGLGLRQREDPAAPAGIDADP